MLKKEWKIVREVSGFSLEQQLNELSDKGYEIKDVHKGRFSYTIVAFIWRKKD
jgi:hypothetical protein